MSKIIYIDADDTLYNTMETFCIQYSALSKEKIILEDLKEWDLYKILKYPFYIDIILNNPNFFANLSLKGNNTVDIVRQLNNSYELYILTSSKIDAIPGKIEAFKRDFPFLTSNQVIFCTNKALLKGDYIVDDAIHNIEGFKNTNKQGKSFCINMPHNIKGSKKIDYRLDTIEEITTYLI